MVSTVEAGHDIVPSPEGRGIFLWGHVLQGLSAPSSGSLVPAWERTVCAQAPRGCLRTRPRPGKTLKSRDKPFLSDRMLAADAEQDDALG